MEQLQAIVQNIKKTTADSTSSIDNDVCDKCGGIGFIFKDKDGYTSAEKCECRLVEEQKNLFKLSGISAEQSNFTIKGFDVWNSHTKKAKELAVEYLKNFSDLESGTGFGMIGGSGGGKTHITCAIANELLRRGIPVRYMPYREVITRLKQNALDEAYYKKETDKYKNAQVLLLDDMFKGKITEADINIMFEIINYRIQKNMPVIFSTELPVSKLLEIDEAISGRLIQKCGKFIIQIKKDTKNNYRLRNIMGEE